MCKRMDKNMEKFAYSILFVKSRDNKCLQWLSQWETCLESQNGLREEKGGGGLWTKCHLPFKILSILALLTHHQIDKETDFHTFRIWPFFILLFATKMPFAFQFWIRKTPNEAHALLIVALGEVVGHGAWVRFCMKGRGIIIMITGPKACQKWNILRFFSILQTSSSRKCLFIHVV